MSILCHYSTINIISNFFVIKYNLPTNWLFLLSLETQWKHICYRAFLRWFIKKFMYDTFVFRLFYLHIFSLHCLITVRCMITNECQRGNHFQTRNQYIFNKKASKIIIRIFCKYIETEIKPYFKKSYIKGVEVFLIYKLIFLLMMSNIIYHFKVFPAKVLSPWGNTKKFKPFTLYNKQQNTNIILQQCHNLFLFGPLRTAMKF